MPPSPPIPAHWLALAADEARRRRRRRRRTILLTVLPARFSTDARAQIGSLLLVEKETS
jgi:hypothetical protein